MREFLVGSEGDDVFALLVPGCLVEALNEPTEAFVIGRVRCFHDELKASLVAKEAGLGSGEELFGAAIFHGIDRERRRRPLGED